MCDAVVGSDARLYFLLFAKSTIHQLTRSNIGRCCRLPWNYFWSFKKLMCTGYGEQAAFVSFVSRNNLILCGDFVL